MTTHDLGSGEVLPRVAQAAIGLAARFFADGVRESSPTTTRADVLFVLDGHITDWSRWAGLPEGDALRFGRLLRRRPSQLANAESGGVVLDRLLLSGQVPGCTAAEDYKDDKYGQIIVDAGMPLDAFVDEALADLDKLHHRVRRELPAGTAGRHITTIRVPGEHGSGRAFVDFAYEIPSYHLNQSAWRPRIVDAPAAAEIRVPFDELLDIAEHLDQEFSKNGGGYRAELVGRFASEVRQRGNAPCDSLDLTAGTLNNLLAYTGFGKSVVLVEVFSCWAVLNGVTVAFVLPTNADVVQVWWKIQRATRLFYEKANIVPLMSPRSLIGVAETASATPAQDGPSPDEIWERLGYGCALASVATTDGAVDAWQPGAEPCAKLRRPRKDSTRTDTVACPWRTRCGRFRAAREACNADVIITTHANFMVGHLQTPVFDGMGVDDRIAVEELLLRRCQVVVIDEADVFQETAIKNSGRGLVLDQAGRTDTPLRRFDADFGAAFGRLHDEVDANVRDSYLSLRYLAEHYVSHLSYGRIGAAPPPGRRRPRGPSRYWVVPRRWDNWLTSLVFDVEPGQVTDTQLQMFRSLFLGEQEPLPGEPESFAQVRRLLDGVVTGGSGGSAVAAARDALEQLLAGAREDERTKAINRVLRRAMLERIRVFLHRLMANNSQMVGVGIDSAQDVADALGVYGTWRATPTGPLGRLVFAFREDYDDTGRQPARLTTAAFGGDPHVYTVTLGDTTALACAGRRRIALGLSATSFFPGAPHHHIHVQPKWWVRDVTDGRVRVEPVRLRRETGDLMKISGLKGQGRDMTIRAVAGALWTTALRAELERLEQKDGERARVLLATTSYESARHIAEGLLDAGVEGNRICLAVRPAPAGTDRETPEHAERRLWTELPADQMEEFPKYKGDILIAPLARVQRGINMIGSGNRSAIGSVWLIVRPIPLIDEPAELLAHIQAKALADHTGPVADPQRLLQDRRKTAGTYLEKIVRRPPYFQAQPDEVKLAVVAEILVGAIQLIGRARRGGTSATLHLVDGAFHEAGFGTDLPTLIDRLAATWEANRTLTEMREYYGRTLSAFLDYATAASPEGHDACY